MDRAKIGQNISRNRAWKISGARLPSLTCLRAGTLEHRCKEPNPFEICSPPSRHKSSDQQNRIEIDTSL